MLAEFNVSKSSFYRKITSRCHDYKDYLLIKKVFDRHHQKVGIRQLRMLLEREHGLIFNHKKIARIKKKYGLETKIRRKNKYRKMYVDLKEHITSSNLLEQNFKGLKPRQAYSTDVTELRYKNGKAYLAAVKDLGSKEILGFEIGHRNNTDLTKNAMKQALRRTKREEKEKLIVHSDQGFNFTHFSYRKLLDDYGVTQSMSRRGNCLDNAPIESFFGLLKDHLELRYCKNIQDVKKEVTSKINYYNDIRPQVALKKMPPNEYRRHIMGPF